MNRLSECVSVCLCEWSSALPHPSIISRLQVSPSLSFLPQLPLILPHPAFLSPPNPFSASSGHPPSPLSPLPPPPLPTKRCHPSPPPSYLLLPVGRASYHVGDMSGLVRHTVCCLRAAAWRLVECGAEQLKCGAATAVGYSNRGARRAGMIRLETRTWSVLDLDSSSSSCFHCSILHKTAALLSGTWSS